MLFTRGRYFGSIHIHLRQCRCVIELSASTKLPEKFMRTRSVYRKIFGIQLAIIVILLVSTSASRRTKKYGWLA
jgi:hypothetical protein